MAVAIAAQACRCRGLPLRHADAAIVVQPGEARARREVTDEFGLVHQYDEELSGEAMEGGPVMLSWQDVATPARLPRRATTSWFTNSST